MPERIVIVGAGQAACQAVVSLRRAGYSGRLALIGDETWPPYHRPPLSKGFLLGDIDVDRLPIRAPAFFAEQDVECVFGARVSGLLVDEQSVSTADDRTWAYDRLLLATGGRARELPCMQNAAASGVFTLRGIADSQRLHGAVRPGARVVIVGGGFIGLETAAALRKMDCSVTVIEAADRLMARVAPPEISRFYQAVHARRGVDVVTDVMVSAIEGDEVVTGVRAGERHWPADLVLVSVGLVPNDDLARGAGLACGNGVLVDAHCRTSNRHVFAAGDVAARQIDGRAQPLRLESVHNAVWQGKAVAAAMLDAEPVAEEVPWFWSDQYEFKLQMAGLPGDDDEWVLRGDPDAESFSVFSLAGEIVTSSASVNAPRDFMAAKTLIAAAQPVDLPTLRDPSAKL